YLFSYTFMFWGMFAWYLLACFLIGVLLVRHGVFHDFMAHRGEVKWGIVLGLAIGLPVQLLGLVIYYIRPDGVLSGLIATMGALPLSLAYLGLILFWSHSGIALWLQNILQAVGRTALSNYILQSILCGIVYYSYGFGLFGKLGHATNFGIVL